MFDLLGWEWSYEPIDLSGYIPDFIVHTPMRCGRDLLIEVKPITDWTSDDGGKLVHQCADKIVTSGWRGRSLIVGATFPFPCTAPAEAWGAGPDIGRLGAAPLARELDDGPDTPTVLARCRDCPAMLLIPDCDWIGYGHDCRDSDHVAMPEDPREFWNRAGARVQWRPA